jgi:glycerol dehydrogenase-like iron-containing ADH family enzyme
MPVEPPGQGKPRSTSWDWSEEEEDEVDKQVAEDIKDISNETLIEAASNEALIIPAEVEGRAVLMEALSMVTEASSSGAGSGSHQLHHGKENVESKTIVSSIDYHKIKYAIKSLKLLIDSTKMGAQSGLSNRKLD